MALLSSGRGFAAALLAAVVLVAGCAKEEAKWCPFGEGIYCPAGASCAARQAVCIWDACGNGHVDGTEACDDGNKEDKDGCRSDCGSTETCGNWITDEEMDEACDDGNTVSGDGCSDDCMSLEACGNGETDTNEDCDGGPGDAPNLARPTPLCTPHCKWSTCGDGYANAADNEGCDGGDPASPGRRETTDCNADCTPRVCGDGKRNVTAGEQCDNGTAQNREDAACLPDCTDNECGDGHRYPAREQCDLGPGNAPTGADFGGACLPGCLDARCGDGNVRAGVEQCDTGPDSALDNHTCPYNVASCEVCNRCQNASGQLTGVCGDGTRQDRWESCDDGRAKNGSTVCDYNVRTCRNCDSTCSGWVDGSGPYCGDGTPNGTEACDQGAGVNGSGYCPKGAECDQVCNGGCNGFDYRPRYCGDNNPSDGEQCDNYWSFQCGTCTKPGCRRAQPAPAKGSIVIHDTDHLAGVNVTLDDGLRNSYARIFLFVEDEPVSGQVDIRDKAPEEVAAAMASTINAAAFGIAATVAGDTVTLTNASGGVDGNAAVVVYPADTTALTATELSGGVGCSLGTACVFNEDCVSGHCRDHACVRADH